MWCIRIRLETMNCSTLSTLSRISTGFVGVSKIPSSGSLAKIKKRKQRFNTSTWGFNLRNVHCFTMSVVFITNSCVMEFSRVTHLPLTIACLTVRIKYYKRGRKTECFFLLMTRSPNAWKRKKRTTSAISCQWHVLSRRGIPVLVLPRGCERQEEGTTRVLVLSGGESTPVLEQTPRGTPFSPPPFLVKLFLLPFRNEPDRYLPTTSMSCAKATPSRIS